MEDIKKKLNKTSGVEKYNTPNEKQWLHGIRIREYITVKKSINLNTIKNYFKWSTKRKNTDRTVW